MREHLLVRLTLVLLLAVPVLFYVYRPLAAAGLNNRSLTLGSSVPSISTNYIFRFSLTNLAPLGAIRFEFCANSPIPGDSCVIPSGFDVSSAILASQVGEIGFSIAPGVTANDVVLTRAPATVTPQVVTYRFDNVNNPEQANTSYYVRITTHGLSDASDPAIEDGGIAFGITDNFSVSAYVPPYLQFCVGVSITGNDCVTAAGSLIDFGLLSETAPSIATSQMAGATNGFGGMAITMTGTTMTSGINTITALNIPAVSIPGTGQFGLNLRANTSPSAGVDPFGPGTTNPIGDYGLQNQFTFRNGDIIASSPISTDFRTLTVSYLVNISAAQAAGVYTSTITYIATATF